MYFGRFGKTISVSMFAAAMIFATPSVECSIYSTCKRISQKLLRNVMKFLQIIYTGTQAKEFKVIRCNCEELVLQGDNGEHDVRIINSYPSKVRMFYGLLFAADGKFVDALVVDALVVDALVVDALAAAPFGLHCACTYCSNAS